MEIISVDAMHLFIFIVPGFIVVWSFRYFTDSIKNSDFEYLILGVIWGLLLLTFNGLVSTKDQLTKLLENPYAAALVFSLMGGFFGWLGSMLSRLKGIKKIIAWLKNPFEKS